MVSFLELPREIRDEIYTIAITAPIPTPSLEEFHHNREMPTVDWDYLALRYSMDTPSTTSVALLLTNRQIHTEANEAIARLCKSNSLRYKLDIALEDENCMYPTWTLLPAFARHVDVVQADFHIFGVKTKRRTAFVGGDGGPPMIVWSLLSLITDFMIAGPHGVVAQHQSPKSSYREGRTVPMTYSIGTIRINVVSPPEPWPLCEDEESRKSARHIFGYRKMGQMIPPGGLLAALERYMSILLYTPKKDLWRPHAESMFERVRTVKVGMDGEVTRTFDVVELAKRR